MSMFCSSSSRWFLLISVAIILLVISGQVICSESVISEEVVATKGEEESSHDSHHEDQSHDDHREHGDHDDEETSSSAEVSSSLTDHDHHPPSSNARGHGESCGEGDGNCDSGAGLICAEDVGKCDCDKSAGEVYSTELGKCEQATSQVIAEVNNNSLEDEVQPLEEDGGKREEGEEVQTDEESSATITTTTTPSVVAVPENENMLEKENESPVMAIQHRTDDDDDGDEVESDEKGFPVGGPCSKVNCEESLGRYSKCHEDTGECECNDVEGLDRPLIIKNDHCLINRQINDRCSSHDDCTATIAGKAWCHMDIETRDRFCQCEMFHYFDDSVKECLPFASDGIFSPCKTDMQCTGFQFTITGHGLGPHARCSQEKGKCECKMGPDSQKAFLYENYCFYQLMPGDHCNINRECEVSFPGQDVACLEGRCMCNNGDNITAVSCPSEEILGGSKRIDGLFEDESVDDEGYLDNLKSAMGLDLPNFVIIMIIAAVVLLVVVIISVLVIKKRHRYSMVRTREPTEEPASP